MDGDGENWFMLAMLLPPGAGDAIGVLVRDDPIGLVDDGCACGDRDAGDRGDPAAAAAAALPSGLVAPARTAAATAGGGEGEGAGRRWWWWWWCTGEVTAEDDLSELGDTASAVASVAAAFATTVAAAVAEAAVAVPAPSGGPYAFLHSDQQGWQ